MVDKDKIEKAVMKGLTEITGMDAESIKKIRNENILKMGIINSLSLASLLNTVESETDIIVDLRKCRLADFETIDSIIERLSLFE